MEVTSPTPRGVSNTLFNQILFIGVADMLPGSATRPLLGIDLMYLAKLTLCCLDGNWRDWADDEEEEEEEEEEERWVEPTCLRNAAMVWGDGSNLKYNAWFVLLRGPLGPPFSPVLIIRLGFFEVCLKEARLVFFSFVFCLCP